MCIRDRLKDNFSDLNEKELQLCCMMVAGFKTEEIAAIWLSRRYVYPQIQHVEIYQISNIS